MTAMNLHAIKSGGFRSFRRGSEPLYKRLYLRLSQLARIFAAERIRQAGGCHRRLPTQYASRSLPSGVKNLTEHPGRESVYATGQLRIYTVSRKARSCPSTGNVPPSPP